MLELIITPNNNPMKLQATPTSLDPGLGFPLLILGAIGGIGLEPPAQRGAVADQLLPNNQAQHRQPYGQQDIDGQLFGRGEPQAAAEHL